MKKKIIIFAIIGAIVGLIVTAIIKAKKWASEIDYGVADGVKLLGMSGQNVQVLIPMWFYNPTPFNLVVSDLNIKVFFNGHFVSTIKSPSNYMIKSDTNSKYPMTVNARPMDIVNLLAEQGAVIDEPNWLEKVDVRLVGSVTLQSGIFRLRDFKIDHTDSLKYWVG